MRTLLAGILILLSFQRAWANETDDGEILYRLRPSELAEKREVQTALYAAPMILASMGPAIAWGGRIQTPFRIFLGMEMHFTPDNPQVHALLAEFGVSFIGRKGGPWASILGGVTQAWGYGEGYGLQPIAKARAGWDLMIGQHFSIGLEAGAAYLRIVQLTRTTKEGDFNLPIELSLPLRIWI